MCGRVHSGDPEQRQNAMQIHRESMKINEKQRKSMKINKVHGKSMKINENQ